MPASPHHRPRLLRSPLACACALALGASALVLGASAAQSQPDEPSGSAFGLTANVSVGEVELLAVEPMPTAECPPDDEDSLADVALPQAEPVITVGVLEVECATDDQGVLHASAEATRVSINLEPGVTAELIAAECTANGEPDGDSTIVGLEVGGEPIAVTGEPNQVVDLALVTLTINRQEETQNDDGTTTLVVDALVVEIGSEDVTAVFPDGVVIISSVTCTSSIEDEPEPTTTTTTTTTTMVPAVGEVPRAPAAAPAAARPTFTG